MAILSPRMAVTNHIGEFASPLHPSVPPVPSIPCRLVTRSSKPPQTTSQEANGTPVSQSFPQAWQKSSSWNFPHRSPPGVGFLGIRELQGANIPSRIFGLSCALEDQCTRPSAADGAGRTAL